MISENVLQELSYLLYNVGIELVCKAEWNEQNLQVVNN